MAAERFWMDAWGQEAARDPPQANGRQACSLLILSATLIGSCVALAVRTLIESGSGLLLMVLMVTFFMSMISVSSSLSRRYILQRREMGHSTAYFGLFRLQPLDTRPSRVADSGRMRRRLGTPRLFFSSRALSH